MRERVRSLNDEPIRGEGAQYVLYWAQMNRRAECNHALNHAIGQANDLGLPVLVYEGLTCTYKEANDRLHTFILENVPEMARRLKSMGAGYCFYLRSTRACANDVFYKLAAKAALVVTDDYPVFIPAQHNSTVPKKVAVAYHAVDSSCIVPMSLLDKREYAAYTIRPKIHRLLPKFLVACPDVPIRQRWNQPAPEFHVQITESNIAALVASCEIDHGVRPSISYQGGCLSAEKTLRHFLEQNLRRYAKDRNQPTAHATSNLSPYLHFGQISSLEVALAAKEYAKEHKLIADEFLEELIVRRELAFNYARHTVRPHSLENLPDWAKETLRKHGPDRREAIYTRGQFENAQTHDPLWNATQKEMLLRGKIHGYYRMYWGKKIIEWSATCQDAVETMIHIHDRYALDGRDPNTYTNILWCFGLHDRPWAERQVFGMMRYMSYDGMKRKTAVDAYIKEIEFLDRTGKDPYRLQ